MSRRTILEVAKRKKQLVRFNRRFEDDDITGYVVSIGPKFFLLLLVSDRFWFDGFECFRISDTSGIAPHENVNFVEEVLRKRRLRRPRAPKVDMQSIDAILLSAAKAFPMVTIHRETVDLDVCNIGQVVRVGGGRVSLIEIGADAAWEDTPTEYKLREITRVNFAGDYENALYLVGGSAPRLIGSR